MIRRATFAESSNAGGSLNLNLNVQRNPPFVCSRCKKTFPTTYALGGHQNAHRRERNEERRLKKPKEKAPILCHMPVVVANAPTTDGQVVEILATPGPSPGPLPWFESKNVQGFMAVANNELVGDYSGYLWGASYDCQNYLKYFYEQQSMPDQEQDLCKEKDLLGLTMARQGDGWLREFPHDATDKNEASRAFDAAELEFSSERELDLTLRL